MTVNFPELMRNINPDLESKEEKNNGIEKNNSRKNCRNERRLESENVKGHILI